MVDLQELIREYCVVLNAEDRLAERKDALRQQIMSAMTTRGLTVSRSPHGSAQRIARFKLLPRRDAVLALLTQEDLLSFASFSPARVREVLVPKYGRERLLPLFDIQKTEF